MTKVLGTKLSTLWTRINTVLVPRQATVTTTGSYHIVTLQNAVTPTPDALVSFSIPASSGGSGDTNQNAFSNVKVGSSTISATSITDTLSVTAGNNISLSVNSKTLTISAPITSATITSALGYTPYSAANPNGYTSNTGTVTAVKINNTTKTASSGIVDLGTVLTTYTYTLPTASTTTLGGVMIDDNTITINSNGVISGVTYAVFDGADDNNAGESGLVPTPTAGEHYYVLFGDGNWYYPSVSLSESHLGTDTRLKVTCYRNSSGFDTKTVTLSTASASYNGLMSVSDKIKLDAMSGGSVWYGTSSTAASTLAKVVTCADYSLKHGSIIAIMFTSANTAQDVTLNVNSTGAKAIYIGNGSTTSQNILKWSANTLVLFMYDSTAGSNTGGYRYLGAVAAASVAPPRGANTWYGYCGTVASTAAKVATISNFVLTKGTIVVLQAGYANTNTGALTLNVNDTGDKSIVVGDVVTSSSNPLTWAEKDILTFVYDGSYWRYVSNSTTYSDFTGATETTTGTHGLVPSPPANGMQYLLYGDGSFHGTWLEYAADSRYVKLMYNDGTEDICSGAALLPLATTAADGFITHTDKTKLDLLSAGSVWYGTCNTVTATSAKEITVTSSYGTWPPATATYTLKTGSIINVYFNYPNTTPTPTINVNSTGAKPIRIGSAAPNDTDNQLMWDAGTLISFIYDEAGDSGRGAYRYLTSVTYGTAYTQEYTDAEIDGLDLEGESAAGIGGISLVPIGTILDFAGSVAPNGYLLCDGSAISRTDYAGLFAVIGTTWGAGNGSTTFNVPDLRGRTAIGAGTGNYTNATTRTLGGTGGSESMQSHYHLPSSDTDWKFVGIKPASGVAGQLDAQAYSSGNHRYVEASTESGRLTYWSGTTFAGDGNSGNMSPYAVVTKIIKAL